MEVSWRNMREGKERRDAILEYLNNPFHFIPVNKKWTIQLSRDRDLLKLLKRGKIRRIRAGSVSSRFTLLVKT